MTVHYTLLDDSAKGGVDYDNSVPSGDVTFDPGETSQAIDVNTLASPLLNKGTEQFQIGWTGLSGGGASFVDGSDNYVSNVTILDTSGLRRDVITDFNPADGDKIDLSRMDADFTRNGDQPFRFIGTALFSAPGQLRYMSVGADTVVQGDMVGDHLPHFEIELMGNYALTLSDFILHSSRCGSRRHVKPFP